MYSAEGWSIDDLRLEGITDVPFSRLVADATECTPAEPTTGDISTTGDTPTSSGSSDDGDSSGSGPTVDDGDAGCGCASDTSSGGWHVLALALLGLRRRRTTR